jgi:hypothetical protein
MSSFSWVQTNPQPIPKQSPFPDDSATLDARAAKPAQIAKVQ